MVTLNAKNRNTSLKAKQLRRKGFIPGVLYGKNLEEPLNIQFPQPEAVRFLKSNSTGSRVELMIGDKKFPALLREISYNPVTGELEHLGFQTLLAGEVVTGTARIVLVNRENIPGVVQQLQSEISYRALPAHLFDKVEIDLDGMQTGTSIKIADLDIAKNPDIEILSPLDSVVLSIADAQESTEETPDETDDEESET